MYFSVSLFSQAKHEIRKVIEQRYQKECFVNVFLLLVISKNNMNVSQVAPFSIKKRNLCYTAIEKCLLHFTKIWTLLFQF